MQSGRIQMARIQKARSTEGGSRGLGRKRYSSVGREEIIESRG